MAYQKETERLDIMHKLTEVSLGGRLNLAPIPKDPKRILDIGTGTGIWAIEMGKLLAQNLLILTPKLSFLTSSETSGDKYPDAEVRLAPIGLAVYLSMFIDPCRLSETILAPSNLIGMSLEYP